MFDGLEVLLLCKLVDTPFSVSGFKVFFDFGEVRTKGGRFVE